MTSVETTLAANTSRNYYNLFTIENNKVKSVARDTYLTGTNGNISFGAGTDYTINASGNNIRIYYTSGWGWYQQTYYVRQSNNTTVGIANNNSNRNWDLYPVTYDIP